MEVKFIIVKKNNKLKHYKSEWLHHYTIARDNGCNENDVIECGMFLDKKMFIMECKWMSHLLKWKDRYIGNALNIYTENRLASWLRGRELESSLYYSKQAIGLHEGD